MTDCDWSVPGGREGGRWKGRAIGGRVLEEKINGMGERMRWRDGGTDAT